MLSFIRKQMSATNLMVIAALVFAMAGGAFAATGGGKHHGHAASHHGHHGHASKKGKKGKKGKNSGKRGPRGKQGPAGPAGETGPAGAAGPAGPAGPVGPAGPAGPAGKDGTNGTNGRDGANGKSVVLGSALGCKEGGVTVEVEGEGSPEEICNGENGAIQAGETLPSGASETGAWVLAVGKLAAVASISFPIPLPSALDYTHVHTIAPNGEEWFVKGENEYEERKSTACKGTVSAPSAEPGNLCVYASEDDTSFAFTMASMIFNPNEKVEHNYEHGGAGTAGAYLAQIGKETEGHGTWAVTAP